MFFPSLPAVREPSTIDIPKAAGYHLCRKSDWNSWSLRCESFLVPITFPRPLFLHQSADETARRLARMVWALWCRLTAFSAAAEDLTRI